MADSSSTSPENVDQHAMPPDRIWAEPPRHVRARRWPRWLAVAITILVVLGAMGAAAPWLASTGPGRRALVGWLNGQIAGRINVDQLSLSWSGPMEARGIRLADPSGGDVLSIDGVTSDKGVWALATAPTQLGNLQIRRPQASLSRGADGEISLLKALRSRAPRPGPLPEISGSVEVIDGSLDDGPLGSDSPMLRNVRGQAAVERSGNVTAALQAFGDGGDLTARMALQDLVKKGTLRLREAKGGADLVINGALDISAIAAVFAPEKHLEGKVTGQFKSVLDGGRVTADVNGAIAGLQTRRAGAVRPVNVTLAGQLAGSGDRYEGGLTFGGDAGKLETRFAYGASLEMPPLQAIIDGALAGQPPKLPEFTLTCDGKLDVGVLAQAVPALLRIREDVSVESGQLVVSGLSLHGGMQPGLAAAIELTGIKGRRGTQEIVLAPVNGRVDVQLVSGPGLDVRQAELRSEGISAVATGTAAALQVQIDGDLSKVRRQMEQVFDMGSLRMTGTFKGSAHLVRRGGDRIDVTLAASGSGLQMGSGGRELRLDRASLDQQGHLSLSEGKTQDLQLHGSADLDGQMQVATVGVYRFQTGGLQAEASVRKLPLSYLASRGEQLGVSGLAGVEGELNLKGSLRRSTSSAPLESQGSGTVMGLKRGGRPVLQDEVAIAWSGMDLSSEGVELRTAKISTSFGEAEAKDVRRPASGGAGGQLGLRADAQPLAAMVAGWMGREAPKVSGRIKWDATLTSSGGATDINTRGTIMDAVIGKGATAFHDPLVEYAARIQIDPRQDSLAIQELRLMSRLLTLQASGTVRQLSARRDLDVTCSYETQWEHLTQFLHEISPATAEIVSVRGRSADRLQIRGPMYDPQVTPAYRDLAASTNVGWDSAELFGLGLGAARLNPQFASGALQIPFTAVPAGGGRVELGASVDLGSGVLTLAGTHKLLDGIKVDRQLSTALLSRINPVFSQVSEIEGTASLSTTDVRLPLGADKSGAGGSGRLALSGMRLRPTGMLQLLLEIGSVATGAEGGMQEVRMSDVDLLLRGDRLRYDNFTLLFASGQFDLKFYGSVGLDGGLDLMVSVPVRAGLLERAGVKGPILEYAKLLSGTRVEIPIGGTRQEPRLDLSKVDVKPLVAAAAKGMLKQQAAGELGKLLGQPVSPPEQGGGQNRPQPEQRPRRR